MENKIESKKTDLNKIQLTFEYIDSKEKLMLPIFFKTLVDNILLDNIENFINLLHNTYSKEKDEIELLLGSIKAMKNIPIEILSKYFARLYTAESNFYKNMNKDLGLSKSENYLPFIAAFYEGAKLKSLTLAYNNILYRGAKILKIEVDTLMEYKNKKIENLPASIVCPKSFLSISKERKRAENFLN